MAAGRPVMFGWIWVSMTWLLLVFPNITAQPEIVNNIQSQTLNSGDTANWDCTVKNKGAYTLYWKQLFNGFLVSITIDESVVAQNPVEGVYPNNFTKYDMTKEVNGDLSLTYRLTIRRLNALDIGLYECSLTKLEGGSAHTIKRNATLSLYGVAAGPRIVNKIGTVHSRVGSKATLLCLVADKGNNPVRWKRLRDNLEITRDDTVLAPNPDVNTGTKKYKIVMFSGDSGVQHALTISGLTVDDTSDYQCYVETGQPNRPYQNGRLEAGVPPTLNTASPLNYTAQNNQRVTIECTATGTPAPHIQWSRADGQLLPNGLPYMNGTTLNIDNMSKEKRGLYKCVASNGIFPEAEILFRVLINFSPTSVPLHDSVTQAVGFSVLMECILEGFPDIVPVWYKVSGTTKTPIANGGNYYISHTVGNGVTANLNYNRFSLNIPNVKQSDYGTYRCEGTSGSNRAFSDINFTESDKCVGSGCPNIPVTNQPVTQTGQTCQGKDCKTGSASVYCLSCGLLMFSFIVTLFQQTFS